VTPIATIITNREISKILKCSSVAEEIRNSNSPCKELNWFTQRLNYFVKVVRKSGKKKGKKEKSILVC